MPDRRTVLKGLLAAAGAAPVRARADAGPVFPRLHGVLETARGRFPLALELADTPERRARGLMFREKLARDSGMLFDFGRTRPVAMWMKNTLVPLDMLFLDADGRIVWIHRGARPLSLETIAPPLPVRYVLELPAGAVARYGAAPGDRLRWQPVAR